MALAELRVLPPTGAEAEFNPAVLGSVFSDGGVLAATLGDGNIQIVGLDESVAARAGMGENA